MSKNIFEQSESRLEQERNVFLQKYGIPVRTDLQRADEIEYATDTQILNKPKENYFAMMDFEEPVEKTASDSLKSISLHSLAAGFAPGAYVAYVLAKNPITRGLVASNIQLGREAYSYMTKDAATLGVFAGMDIDTRMKEYAKIDEEKANMPASLRLQDKVMGDVKRVGEFLTPFAPIDEERVKERIAAWPSEQKKVDEFNEKVKIVVDNFLERSGLAKNEKDGFLYDFGAVGGSVLSSISLLAMFRIPAIGAMLFAAAEGQGTYEEAIKAGITPEKAYGLGKINATWIAATEMLGDKFLSKILYGKGVLGKYSKKILESVKKGKMPAAQDVAAFAVGAAKSGGIESIQETSQNIGSDIIGNVGGISEKSASDIIKGGFYSGALAFPFGFFGGGVASLSNFRQYADNVSKTLQDHGMEKETADKIGREMALTVTSSEFVDDAIKAVSSEINSPLTAEDRDPQKFARVLTEAQTREIEQESWNVEERVREQGIAAGVAPEVAEASSKVAQTVVNNLYTLAKITPSDQKNFKISVIRGDQDNVERFVNSLSKEEQVASASALSGDLEFNAVSFEDEQQMQYSLEQAKEYSDKTGFSVEQIQSIYDFAKTLIQKSMKMGKMNKHDAFVAWNEFRPDVFIDDITQLALPLSSVFKKNGDFPVNCDFGTICIKRESLDFLIRHIVNDPDFVKNVQNMGVTQMDLMKYVLKENGYLTACDVCFVEGKRLRQLIYANSLSYEWESVRQAIGLKDNKMVGQEIKLTAKQVKILEEMADNGTFKQAFEKYMPEERRRLKRGKTVLDSGITADKMQSIAELFLLDQSLAGQFNPNWLLSSAGVDWLKKRFTVSTKGRISSFLASMYASATPKPIESQAPYVGTSFVEIDMNEERDKFRSRKQRGSLIEKLFNIGGARMQSFSDFNAMLTIDNLQLFLDCTLRGIPLQVYTKEPAFVKLFGETGANINMSFVPNVGQNSDETNAGLKAATQEQIDAYNKAKAKGDDYLKEQIVNRQIENVYTDEDGVSWVYDWSEDSFPIEEAYKLRREFKGNVGIIGVGISDKHILMMLNDPAIDMIIPFHSSGMPTHTKVVTGLGQRTADYEKVQTTKGLKKGVKDFVFNEDLQHVTKDAKKSAENYKKFCKDNGATPKYPQFKDHENYYKLLEDFRSYDNDGNPVIQEAVNILNINQDNFLKNLHEALGVREEQLNKMANLPQDTKTLEKLKEIFEPQRADGATREAIESRLQKVLGKDNVQILEQRKFFDALREEMSKDVGAKEAEKRVEVFRDSGKYVYGFAKDGKIFLNETTFNAETPAHEFTHIWVKVARAYNPKRWKEGVKLLKKTTQWEEVMNDPLYANIRGDEDAVASEVLARIVGIENGKIINKVLDPKYKEPKEVSTAVQKVLEWFRKLWEDVRDFFDLKDGDAKLTYDEFVMMPLRDLWEDSRSSNFMEKLKNLREMKAMDGEGEMQTGFHGGPNRFDTFPLEHIGTGEGAQMHGYGVYVAEQKGVGIHYRTTRGGQIFYKGKPINELMHNLLITKQYNRAALVEDFVIKMDHEALDKDYYSAEDWKWFEEEILPDIKQEGMLAEVEIPENDVLLDEQKTFENQPEKVQKAIKSLGISFYSQDPDMVNYTARTYIERIYDGMDKEDALKEIRKRIEDTEHLIEQNEGILKEAREMGLGISAYDLGYNKEAERHNIELLKEAVEIVDKLEKSNSWYKGKTGGEIYRLLTGFNGGSPKRASKQLLSIGVEGITYDGEIDGRCFVIFDDKAVKIKKTFYQGEEGTQRGEVTIDENAHEAVIRIFQNSDPSTIIHELAHVYLTMIHNASQISVDPEFQQLVADINAWLGEPAGENGAYSVEQQEMFARGFEGYMAEGKSPNKEMEGIFAKFAEWLAEVYKSVKDYLQITPEVRSIFDRLLAPEETVKKSKYVGKAERAKQLMESVKTGIKNEDALELPEMKALLSTASTRRPAVPKLNLLKDLKKHGANYENSAKIDKEAYANAGVKDSKEGIDDKPDLWLQKMGYMDFEESTEETVNQAWQMIEDALSGKEVYRLEDQDRVAQIEAYDANLKLLQEIFPDFMGVADTRRMISELERKGYRVVEKKDIKALEKALDRLTDTEKKKDEKQFLTMARRVREGVIAELEKRQIAGKDQMVELLKNAKTVEEITSAVEGVLGQVTSAWEQTEEGKQEQRKAELPKTDWGKKRAKLLAEINGIVKKAGESVAEAQKTLSSFVGRILTEEEAKEKERAERIIKNSNLEGQIIKALMESVRGEAHINPADINKIVARLAHSLQRNRLMTEYSVDDFIESAKKIQEKNYKKYIFKKLGDIFSRKVFEKVGTTKRLKYSPKAARFLTDAHKVWNDPLEKIQKEYYDIVKNLNKERQVIVDKEGNVVDKNLPPEPFEVLRRMAIALRADPEAQSMEVFQDFYENVLSAVRGDALEKRMEVLKRMVDEQTLRLAMGMSLDKRKIGKAELNFLLYGGTDFQTMLSILFGKVKVMMPESDSGLVEIDFREELSPETEQIKAAIFVHEARQKLLKAVMDAYGLKSADQAVGKVAELQNDKMEILNYGEIKDESKGQIVARLFDENGKEYTNSKVEKETITKEEILTFWLWDQDHVFIETENGVEDFGLSGRLTRAYGREQLNAMFDKLTEEDKRFARSLQKMLSDVHQLESDVHFRTFGFALPKKENYFPSVTERTDDSIDYQQQMIDNSKSPSFVKERAISRNVRQKKVSPTKLVMSHLMRASEFIYESEKFNKLRRLINNPDTVRSFENKFGREDGKKIYKKLQDLVVLQGPAQRKTQGELLALAEKAFNGWVKASLGMKVVTGVKQFASSVSFAENMPAEKWAMWFAEGLANPRKTAEFMHKMSPYIQTRYESGGVNETVARAMTQDSIQPFATRWNNLTNMLLINTRLGDKASLIYGGYPYLRYLIEEKGMTPEAAAKAFEKQAVRSMQSSLKANTSMSQANADSLPVRLVLAFKNQQMQYVRKVADSYVQWKNKEISTKQFGKVLFLYIVLNPTVYVLLSLGWFSDDEEERKNDLFRLLTAPLTQTLDAYPVAGAAMEFALESLYRVLQEEDLARPQSIGLPMVNDFYRDIGDVVSKINEGDAETMDFMMAFLDFAKYFGVPVGTLANTVGGVKDIATGKPVRGLMRTVGYTKNRSSKVTGDEE